LQQVSFLPELERPAMFSVVIPLFDKGPYVGRAVDSVAAQAVLPAEVVVVNDGSRDDGAAVARAAAERFPVPLRVIDQPNRGVSAARNAGISAASQPFVAFLDADDRWRPEFLARMRDLIAAWPGAVLYGSGFVTIRDGRPERRYGIRAADLLASAPGGPAAGPVDFFRAWRNAIVTNSSSIVVPRIAADAIGGFAGGVTHGEDHLFWTRLALAGRVVLTAEPLTEYDVSVPGQAVEYWRQAYKERFDVLEFHRFLADELRGRIAGGRREADQSFVAFARGELRKAALQRLYWGDFAALATLWRELRLDGVGLGWPADWCGWIARHPAAQPPVAGLMVVARRLRGLVAGGPREASAA
jgi:glycosyltransferase involved in cell wall biosynthesis